jgi:peptidoglycan/xylan/chitin deacetylase (PgdA/CDA1 family)
VNGDSIPAEAAPVPQSDGGRLFDAMSFIDGGMPEPPRPRLLETYYRIRSFMPRSLRLAVRRLYSKRQATHSFRAWPVEPILVDRLHDRFRETLATTQDDRVPFINFWPGRKRFAFILTHDVEGPRGVENIPRLLELEQTHGLVSSWNFVAQGYAIPADMFRALRAVGCEVGLHGLTHDGSLFRDRGEFKRQLPEIHRYMADWGVVGFRSPATHRNPDWMPELGCLYDSSFPDTDPFEPQPGGCCSIWPYFLGDLVELPITMVQDHTLFEILRERSIQLWLRKADWLIENHGLVNVLVHPDYMLSEDRLQLYDELLGELVARPGGWHALPRDVAVWWRERAALERSENSLAVLETKGVAGTSPILRSRARIAYARSEGGRIVFDV